MGQESEANQILDNIITNLVSFEGLCFVCRLQQPVQNSISDNTNGLWNSPSLGKNTAIGYPWFYKTTPFLSFEGKKQGQTHIFFLV